VIGWVQKSIFWFRKGITCFLFGLWILDRTSLENIFVIVRVMESVTQPGKIGRPINIKGDGQYKNQIYQYVYFFLLSYFPIYYFFSFFIVVDVHCLWWSPRAVRSARAAHSRRMPWRTLLGVPFVLLPARLLRQHVQYVSCSPLGPLGDMFLCEQWQWHIEHTYLYTFLK
jgi:hypothetical protein